MASKKQGFGSLAYLDTLAFQCSLTQMGVDMKRDNKRIRTIGCLDTIKGPVEAGAKWTGLGEFGADAYEEGLDTKYRAGTEVNFLMLIGSAAGDIGYEVVGPLTEQVHAWPAGDLLGLSGAVPDGKVTRQMALNVSTAITGTGAQTGQEVGATASGVTTAVTYRVLAVSGSGSVTFACQESSDDGGGDAYAAISGLGATFTAVGVQRLTTTAATEAWKRLSTTAFSGFTSVTVLVTVGQQAT